MDENRILSESICGLKNQLIVQFDLRVSINPFKDQLLKRIFDSLFRDSEVESIGIVRFRDPFDQRIVVFEKRIRNVSGSEEVKVDSGGNASSIGFGLEGLDAEGSG